MLLRAVDDKVRELTILLWKPKPDSRTWACIIFNAGHVEEACGLLFGDANGLLRGRLRNREALPFMFGSRAGARSAETISALGTASCGNCGGDPQLPDAATVMNSLGEREREADLIATAQAVAHAMSAPGDRR